MSRLTGPELAAKMHNLRLDVPLFPDGPTMFVDTRSEPMMDAWHIQGHVRADATLIVSGMELGEHFDLVVDHAVERIRRSALVTLGFDALEAKYRRLYGLARQFVPDIQMTGLEP